MLTKSRISRFLTPILFLLAPCVTAAPPSSNQIGKYTGKGSVMYIYKNQPKPVKFTGTITCEVKNNSSVTFTIDDSEGNSLTSFATGDFGPSAGIAKHLSGGNINSVLGLSFQGTGAKTKLMLTASLIWEPAYTLTITAKNLKKVPQ